jgi:hypothetical protein
MWNVKTKVIPVIIGATGTISKSFKKYVSSIPGNHEVEELEKTVILGTAHILREVPVRIYRSFPHYLTKDTIFGKKVTEHKMCSNI